jgi:phage protein D
MTQRAYQIAFAGTAVDQDFYGDVISLRVEENTSMAGAFQLRLATELAGNGSWKYLDDDHLALFTKVSIKLGFTTGGGLGGAPGLGRWSNGLIPVFDGYVTSVDLDLGSEPGSARIDIGGMDTSVLMSLEEKIATWKDMSDSAIVQQIVSSYGAGVQADSSPNVHRENDTIVVQRTSDIRFVRDLAERNGLEFYFETGQSSGNVVAYFRAPQLDGTPQPDLAIRFGDQSNLRSFSAYLSGQRPLSVKLAQIDVAANSPNTAQVGDMGLVKLGDKDANVLVGGPLGALVTPKDTQGQMLVLGHPTSDPGELQTLAQAVRDEAAWFIAAQGEVNSEAYQNVLRPHRLVLVKGAGKAYSGKYYVTRVVHELKGDSTYTQTFEARRNARDLDGSESFGADALGLPMPGIA